MILQSDGTGGLTMNDEFKVIANITVPVDDVTEQAFREGYIKEKAHQRESDRIHRPPQKGLKNHNSDLSYS